LYIANANRQDSGNYSCALAEIAQTTVMVHVLNGKKENQSFRLFAFTLIFVLFATGENPAAMQHGAGQQWQPFIGLLVLSILSHFFNSR
jgi:hypothetical protein